MPPIKPLSDVFEKRVLDVGCGHGRLLKTLAKVGFKNLHGVDPFVEESISHTEHHTNQIQIYKSSIYDIKETYDIIMLNHSLEHMPEQEKTLRYISSILAEDGVCIVRIPILSSWGWLKYKENWYAIDAPRHLHMHSMKSIEYLVDKCGLRISNVIYDGYDGMGGISISRYYQKGLSHNEAIKKLYRSTGWVCNIWNKLKMKRLNKRSMGDQVAIYLSKKLETHHL